MPIPAVIPAWRMLARGRLPADRRRPEDSEEERDEDDDDEALGECARSLVEAEVPLGGANQPPPAQSAEPTPSSPGSPGGNLRTPSREPKEKAWPLAPTNALFFGRGFDIDEDRAFTFGNTAREAAEKFERMYLRPLGATFSVAIRAGLVVAMGDVGGRLRWVGTNATPVRLSAKDKIWLHTLLPYSPGDKIEVFRDGFFLGGRKMPAGQVIR